MRGATRDTLTKAQVALKANDGPTMAVVLAVDAHTLIDDDLIVPFDGGGERGGEDRAWLDSFYPAFLANGRIGGHTWGVPFQRSTIVLYWNKNVFKDAGLDPERAPQTWVEHAEMAAKISKPDGRWGTLIPGTGFTYWLYQALVTQAGGDAGEFRGNAGGVRQSGGEGGVGVLDGVAGFEGDAAGVGGLGDDAARLPGGAGGDDLDDDGEPLEHSQQCEVSVWGGDAAGGEAAGESDGGWELRAVQGGAGGAAGGRL